jgi:hypothetical protein
LRAEGALVNTSSSNRKLYVAITELIADRNRSPDRELEAYLRALLGLCRPKRAAETLSPADFLRVLSDAFTAEPLDFDAAWKSQYEVESRLLRGYEKFEAVAIQQIVDLNEMRDAGILAGEWINLGVDSPRGERWYNFEPRLYLECAVAGSIGGWEPGDPTGRDFVPGSVAVVDADGKLTSADPQELTRPNYEINEISWDQFADFLWCGQEYE